jgi:hypothetical protein
MPIKPMKTERLIRNPILAVLLLSLLPTITALVVRSGAGTAFSLQVTLKIWLLSLGALTISKSNRLYLTDNGKTHFPLSTLLLGGITIVTVVVATISGNKFSAWLALGCFFALLLLLADSLVEKRAKLSNWLVEGLFVLVAGGFPVAWEQIISRFSTEEFFAALEAASLLVFWVILRLAAYWFPGLNEVRPQRGLQVSRGWLTTLLVLIPSAFLVYTIRSYQNSFYPAEAPTYQGISSENPFICGGAPTELSTYDAQEVYQRLLERVEANPYKESPEYAMLALGTGDERWAVEFRQSLLSEADQGLYTAPANSVKYGQYLAGKRAYYYPKMVTAFPDLFTPVETKKLQTWFQAINQRTFTVEWIDWMYALAFTNWPEGPYENQETGAGLLSLMEAYNLSDPAFTSKNQSYLADNPRGWNRSFRVTDDAAIYQKEWIENAMFQNIYAGISSRVNRDFSFQWLALLSPPDGSPLGFNHIGQVFYGDIAYLGAILTEDPTYIWLSGRALDYLENTGGYLSAQPGTDQVIQLVGQAPQKGSCLLFGGSGLPTQVGPIAPDKVVFRSGWQPDGLYALLNLRFTGWHRYKATNTITSIYLDGPLVVENTSGEVFEWLPTGRSLYRDKRIPRENLNGLVIAKSGISAVLQQLTGIGSAWAQDPPYYAQVEKFETTPAYDLSVTQINDWHGWWHKRMIYYSKQGIVVVFDEANGPPDTPAKLIWHLVTNGSSPDDRIRLGTSQTPVEAIFIPIKSPNPQINTLDTAGDGPNLRVQYSSNDQGYLQTITIFLTAEWIGAEVDVDLEGIKPVLRINQNGKRIEINLDKLQK